MHRIKGATSPPSSKPLFPPLFLSQPKMSLAGKLRADLLAAQNAVAAATAALAALSSSANGLLAIHEAKTWRVSDCHSHCPAGDWAQEALKSGSYGICVTPSSGTLERSSTAVPSSSGDSVTVSKKRWNAAKDIKIGDTLYMADTVGGVVLKGLVTAEVAPGPFKTISRPTSFRRRIGERLAKNKRSLLDSHTIGDEVELEWTVTWIVVSPLTQDWRSYLRPSVRATVIPLAATPPA